MHRIWNLSQAHGSGFVVNVDGLSVRLHYVLKQLCQQAWLVDCLLKLLEVLVGRAFKSLAKLVQQILSTAVAAFDCRLDYGIK